MKQNKNSFSILLACLSAIAVMSGCNWENEEYDKFVNPSLGYAIRCPGYCDTTNIEITKEKCNNAEGTWINHCNKTLEDGTAIQDKNTCTLHNGQWIDKEYCDIYVKTSTQCEKLTDNINNWYQRKGISFDEGVYMFKDVVNEDIAHSEKTVIKFFCGTHDELNYMIDDTPTECETYINEKKIRIGSTVFNTYQELKTYFNEMTDDTDTGYSLCPSNTLACTYINVKHPNTEPKINKWPYSVGFCSSCEKDSVMCYDKSSAQYKCTNITTNDHCGTCNNDCTIKNQTCQNGVCVSASCKLGQHVSESEEKGCDDNTEKMCGAINCTKLDGWKNGFCGIKGYDNSNNLAFTLTKDQVDIYLTNCSNENNGSATSYSNCEAACVATECLDGFTLNHDTKECQRCTIGQFYNPTTARCEDDTINNCGDYGYSCENHIAGWKTGECIEGKCVASECVTGYNLVDGKCEAKTSCTDPNTHYYNGECIKNDLGNCGAHGYACAVNMTGWKEGECVTGECVASECVTGYDVVSGRCEAKTSCEDPDTHYYNGECIDNDLSNCGKHNNRCADITGWKDGKCEKGVCDPDDCVVGYHLDAEGKACVADDTDNCGSVGRKCGGGQVCTAGDCKDNCGSGEVRCEKDGTVSCADPKTSMMYCGANATCSSYDTCMDGKVCIGGECKQTSCSGDTTLCAVGEENQCINLTANNADHCGACNLKCSDQKVSNATSNACSAGKCQYTCDQDYKNCGSAEVPNCIAEANLQTDPNNCGNCGVKCKADEYCSAGGCKKSTCDSNQCLTEGTCANSDTRCGTQCIDCNTANNATSGTCSDSGECKITECMAGYHLASDNKTCVPNTRTACAPVNSSTTTDCTNSNHAEDGYCSTDGACYYTLCATGYHADEGTCVKDSDTACGATKVDCTSLAGWKAGTCDSGVCKASTCDPNSNYCLSGTTCVDGRYNSLACGKDGSACGTCGTDEACSNGECVQSSCGENVCFYMGASCQNDATHCGSTCTDCNTANDAASGTCTASGDCEITTCAAGYHRVTNASGKYACILNTSNACGAVDATEAPVNCNNANNAASGVCNSDGSCTILSCTTGFHLDNTLRCVEDDENACGAHAIDCEAQDGWATANCDGGTCKPLTCDSGYHTTTDNKCVPDSPTACGSETNTCYSQGVALAFCNNGNCYIASCNDGYLVNNNESCELSCGGSICTTASIENSAAVECADNTTCAVTKCATGYHKTDANAQSCTINTDNSCAEPTEHTTTDCTNTVNTTCSESGACCRPDDSTNPDPSITDKPNCCNAGYCKYKTQKINGVNTNIYKCSSSTGSGWKTCTP